MRTHLAEKSFRGVFGETTDLEASHAGKCHDISIEPRSCCLVVCGQSVFCYLQLSTMIAFFILLRHYAAGTFCRSEEISILSI